MSFGGPPFNPLWQGLGPHARWLSASERLLAAQPSGMQIPKRGATCYLPACLAPPRGRRLKAETLPGGREASLQRHLQLWGGSSCLQACLPALRQMSQLIQLHQLE